MGDRLFELTPPESSSPQRPDGRVVRVVVDVGAIVREFDYVVPARWVDRVDVGTMVRVPLHGRRLAGWVVALDPAPPAAMAIESISKVTGAGPPSDVVELCRWAAWRWAGRLPHFLGAASPPRAVLRLPDRRRFAGPIAGDPLVTRALHDPRSVIELAPAQSRWPIVRSLLGLGSVLVVCPDYAQVASLVAEARRGGVDAVSYPDGWALAAGGAPLVVGARRAVFAPMPELGAIVVIDEHDEAHQNEGSPTWHVRELAFERGRRRRVPVIATSAMPSLEARRHATVVTTPAAERRAGWAPVVVIDRRDDDRARLGLYSEQFVRLVTTDRSGHVVCVLNRLGRAALVACGSCRTPAACHRCAAAVALDETGELVCRHCKARRPPVCQACGSTALRQLRIGVTRAREDLEALLGEPVAEVTGKGRRGAADARVVVGSEAALHQVPSASVVAFLEFDQELMAPRYRASEQALALIVRAARLVDGRRGRVLVQTQMPEHPVLAAAIAGSADSLATLEATRRRALGYPPASCFVVVGGPAADDYVQRLRGGQWPEGWVAEPAGSGDWLLRGEDRAPMLDLLSATPRPPGRLRLWVDPMRLPG